MKKKPVIAVGSLIVLAIVALLLVTNIVIPANKYKKALSLMDSGNYEEAVSAFTALGDYKDSAEKAKESQQKADYLAAEALLEDEDYEGAVAAYTALGEYEDSADKAKESQQKADYLAAEALFESEDYEGAAAAYTALGEYEDSADKAKESKQKADYLAAEALFESEDYEGAAAAYTALGEYEDSADKAKESQQKADYLAAEALYESEDYEGAAAAYTALGEYEDSADKAKESQQKADYLKAGALFESGDYEGAVAVYTALGDYEDSIDLAQDAQNKLDLKIARENLETYNSAVSMAEVGAYSDAYKAFDSLGQYNDSEKKCEEVRTARFEEGMDLYYEEEYQNAYNVFKEVDGWKYHETYAEVDEQEPAYYMARCQFCMDQFEEANAAFTELGEYKDSIQQAQYCLDEPVYRNAKGLFSERKYEDAKEMFESVSGYRDSAGFITECENHITYTSLKGQLDEINKSDSIDDKQKNTLKEVFTGFISLGEFSDSKEQAYQIAGDFFEWEDYETSAEMYLTLGGYEDSNERMQVSQNWIAYRKAEETIELAEKEEDTEKKESLYKDALNAFNELGSFSDSKSKVYSLAQRYLEMGDLESAIASFNLLGDYSDSKTKVRDAHLEMTYRDALSKKEDGDYEGALEIFTSLCSTEEPYDPDEFEYDESEWGEEWIAVETEAAVWEETISHWPSAMAESIVSDGLISGYKDSLSQIDSILEQLKNVDYTTACTLMNEGKYEEAKIGFDFLGEYSDSKDKASACETEIANKAAYESALALKEEGKYEDALKAFKDLGDYSDSKTQMAECEEAINENLYESAVSLKEEGKYEEALKVFEDLGEYSDSKDQVAECEKAIEDRETVIIEDDAYRYMSVQVEAAQEVSEEEISSEISESFFNLENCDDLIVKTTEGTVKDGDRVNIDYVGKKDDIPFDGGSAEGQDLVIGSGSFIQGFEDGLIGKEIGSTVDLNLTFPTDYGVEELNGADVVFTVTINYVANMPQITDEIAQKLSGGEYATADDYKESIRSSLQTNYDAAYKNMLYGEIIEKLMELYPIYDLPQEEVDKTKEILLKLYIDPYAKMHGREREEYIESAYGISYEAFEYQEALPSAEQSVKQNMILGAIAEKENITITDKELQESLEKYAKPFNVTVDDISTGETMEYIRKAELDIKVMDWLIENIEITTTPREETESVEPEQEETEINSEGVMTYDEYEAAEVDEYVVIEAYVQGKQELWLENTNLGTDTATIYAQDQDGGYFLYDIPVSEDVYEKLEEGTKIRVCGYKSEWAGETEIVADDDLTPVEILDGSYIADPIDITEFLDDQEILKKYQNQKVCMTDLTVESADETDDESCDGEAAFLYGWDGSGSEGDDLYFKASKGGKIYTFVVESYLRGPDSDVYQAVKKLKIGDRIMLEGFLYWYEVPQPHITSVSVIQGSEETQ